MKKTKINILSKFKPTKLFRFAKRSNRKQRLIVLGILVAMAVPFVLNTLNYLNNAEANWSPSHSNWIKRKRLKLTNNSIDSLAANTTVAVSINTKELHDLGKLTSNCSDLRVLYQPDSSTFTDLPKHVELPNNTTCSSSESTHVYFKLQAALGSGSTSGDYYMYYANSSASAPAANNDAFDLTSTNAMLVCPFRGTSSCVNGSGTVSATTSSGALRYPGLKSALLYDGVNDYSSAVDSSSLSVTGDLTVEAWVKTKKTGAEQTIIGKWDETTGTDDRSYRLYITSGDKFAFSVSTSGTAASATTITGTTSQVRGIWYHVAGVYDASAQTLNLYVNGVSNATQVGSAGSSIDNNASLLYLGAKENTSGAADTYFAGIMEEVRISNNLRYTAAFAPSNGPFNIDYFTQAQYHIDEAGNDPRQSGKISDETAYANHATVTGAVFVSGFVGSDGPSEFGSHSGSSNASILSDTAASWVNNEWVGYILFNSTDASHGIVTSNTVNTLTATLAGGTENDWDNGDLYTLSPDLGKVNSQAYGEHNSIFLEEATTNKITNPSFENTTYDTGWVEGSGAGAVIAVTRTTASTGGGTQDITNSNLGGNTPKAVTIIATGTTSDGTAADDVVVSLGSATGTTNEWYTAFKNDHGDNPDDTDSTAGTDATINVLDASNSGVSSLGKAEFTQFITNGVRINWTTTATQAWHLTVILYAGSSLQAHANSQALGITVDVPFDITAPGFQPDVVIGASNVQSTNSSYLSSYGFARYDGATITQHSILNRFGGMINTIAAVRYIDLGIVGGAQINGNLVWYGELSSFDSSGFTITPRTAGPSGSTFYYLALDVGSLSTWVGTHSTPTSTGNYSETAPGFTPQFVFQVQSFAEALNTAYQDSNAGTLGFSTFDPNLGYANSWGYQDNATSTNSQTLSDDQSVNIPTDTGATGVKGTFVSMDSGNGWTTNYSNVTGTAKKFASMAIQSPAFLTKTIETSEPYVKFGSRSTKIVASGADTTLVNSLNPGNTNTHTMSAYVYRGTAGSIGGTVDNTVARIVFNSANQSTTAYENVGGGWWRLTYSAAGVASSGEYGIWLANGETLYVDGFQLEEKSLATTYTDGSLGTGYTWSGTINQSTSSRAIADLDYAVSSNIQASAGSVSFWVRPNWAGNDGVEHTFFDVDTSVGTLKLYKTTGNVLTLTDGTNTATSSTSGWSKGSWHHIAADWGSSNMHVYIDAAAGTAAGAYSTPTLGTSLYIGQSKTNTSLANASISDFRVFDAILTSAEVTDLYYAGLVAKEEMFEIDAYQGTKGQDPVSIWHFDESYGTTANDSTTFLNHLTISGATWDTQSVGGGSLRTRNLKFDGSNDYLTRDPDGDFNFGTESFSITGWFRHPSTISGTDVLLARFGTAGYKIYMDSSGFLCFGIDADSTWTPADSACSSVSYADSLWHQFVAVKTGTTSITLYVDSRQVAQDASLSATTTLNSNSPIYIGIDSDATSNPWDGFLDEIIIYPYARSAEQIKADYFGNQVSALYGVSSDDLLTDGLIGYWKMDENSWTADCTTLSVTDSSGNGNHGKACPPSTGPTGGSLGKFGNAGTFDGANDYVTVTNNSTLNPLKFTVSFWLKKVTEAADFDFIVGKRNAAGQNDGWATVFDDSPSNRRVYFSLYDTSGTQFSTYGQGNSLSTGTWRHYIFTFDGNKILGYEDGVLISQTQVTNTYQTASNGLYFATYVGTSSFPNITIDETRYYNRALSPAEVSQLYNWTPGPVVYYSMDENVGTTNVNDRSGNGNNGSTIGSMNQQDWVQGKFGSALDFDGSDDGINGQSADMLDNMGAITVSAWINPRTAGEGNYGRISDKSGGTTPNNGWFFFTSSSTCVNSIHFELDYDGNDLSVCSANNTLNYNIWQHVAVTFDGTGTNTGVRLYINGIQQAYGAQQTSGTGNRVTDAAQSLYVGNNSGQTRSFNGIIDDIKVYNYVRTGSQIIQDMNAGHPTPGSPIGSALLHYKFDEGYGDTAYDSGTGINNGDLGGSGQTCPASGTVPCPTGIVSGKFNHGLTFDGVDDYISAGSATNLDDQEPFTISAWIKPVSGTNDGYIVARRDGASTGYWAFKYEDGFYVNTLGFSKDTDGTTLDVAASDNTITEGSWNHIAMTWDGTLNASGVHFYVNGRETTYQNQTNGTGNKLSDASHNTLIGSRGGSSVFFKGDMDEVKMYNSVLTANQIKVLYNFGSSQTLGDVDNQDNEGFGGNPPVGWWKIDEGTGTTTINDFSGNANNLTMNNLESTDWAQYTRFNYQSFALTFDGSNEYLSRADDPDFDFGSGDFSVSAWVRHPTISAADYILTKADTTTGGYKLYMDDSGDFCFAIDDDTSWTPDDSACTVGVDYDDNTWHHVTGVVYTNGLNLYVDGILVARDATLTSVDISNTNALYVGIDRDGTSGGWDGQIDDVRIHNYALSQSQVSYLLNRSKPFAWYKLDECSGTNVYNSAPIISGADAIYDGTITIGAGGSENTVGDCNTSSTAWGNGANGKYNSSIDLDGTDDYINIGDYSIFEPHKNSDFTVEAWVNRDTFSTTDVVVAKTNDITVTTAAGWSLYIHPNDAIILLMGDGSNSHIAQTTSPYTITSTGWNHIVATYTNEVAYIYLNGVQATSGAGSLGGSPDNALNFRIGSESDGGEPFDGKIDNVKFYNTYFTAGQVKRLYNEGSAVRFAPSQGSP